LGITHATLNRKTRIRHINYCRKWGQYEYWLVLHTEPAQHNLIMILEVKSDLDKRTYMKWFVLISTPAHQLVPYSLVNVGAGIKICETFFCVRNIK